MNTKDEISKLVLNQEKYLSARSVHSIVSALGKLSKNWLNPNDFFRKKAVKKLILNSKFSESMAEQMIDGLFGELTAPKLLRLLKFELKNPNGLDGFVRDALSRNFHCAQGPKIITHIFSGNVPNPSIMSFVFGMLIKSANIGKLSSKDEGFLEIYLESLEAFDKNLAKTNILLDPKDNKSLTRALEKSELVVAYGNNASIEEIKKLLPTKVSFVGYGHRVSFGLITKDVLQPKNLALLAKRTAQDIWMMDQRGCLSPQTIFVEEGASISPLKFAKQLALSLSKFTPVTSLDRFTQHQILKNNFKLTKIKNKTAQFLESDPPGHWMISCDDDLKQISFSGGGMAIGIKAYKNFSQVVTALKPFQKALQAISLECLSFERPKYATELSRLGFNRICRAGKLQLPPITWHHDGALNLASWVRWTDLETE